MRAMFCAVCAVILSSAAYADITTVASADFAEVQITQGLNSDCSKNKGVFDAAMKKGDRKLWGGAGTQGDSICWRRSVDPSDASKGLTEIWNVCLADGDCDIN